MTRWREGLEPVMDESSLRAGCLCVLRRCRTCKSQHRFMLLGGHGGLPAVFMALDGGVYRAPPGAAIWKVAPAVCGGCSRFPLFLAIAERRLFRVRTGIERETSVVARKKQGVRA